MMTPQPRYFRIFLSSPGDVAAERAEAIKLMDQLPYDPAFRDKITIRPVAWDKEGADTPLLATMTPQEAINQGLPQPSECDIVIVIFWSRMGTPLPTEYVKGDGSRYLSGTEWEYWDGYNAAKATGKPLLLVYRRTEKVLLDDEAPDYEARLEQKRRVKDFFAQFVGPMGELLSGYNAYETPDQFRAKLETHLKILLLRLLKTPAARPPVEPERPKPVQLWTGSPFPGLRAFLPKDEPIFFGRGRETDALVKRVSESRFVAVVGASGSGKSSLAGAGLIPRLVNNAIDGSKDWKWLRFTPGGLGDNPFMALAAELKNLTERHGWNARQIADKLLSDPLAIEEIAAAALTDQPVWAELLLFIDQFEELFTLVKPEYVTPFASLLNVLAASKRVRVVVTLRSDFYHRCVDVPGLVGLLQSGSYPLGVPDAFALLEMIERPAERAGLAFEADLPKRMVRDTGAEPGGLALLAYTLDELYERCKGKRTLSATDYDALEGVQGAIGTRAENTFTRLDSEAQAAFTSVFRNLVEVDERGTATRQRATLSRFTAGSATLINAFVEARLFVTSAVGTMPASSANDGIVEVAHEALLRKWGRLADWIEGAQDDLRLLRQMQGAAREWDASGRKRGFLWIGERGEALAAMLKQLQPELNEIERLFARPEADHLLDEINDETTSHQRRSAIGERLSIVGDPRRGVGLRPDGLPDIEWLPVPGGKITLRDDEGRSLGDFTLNPFYIAKYPITYVQFQAFLDAPDGFGRDEWWRELDKAYRKQEMNEQSQKFASYPRENVSWFQAVAFANWLNAKYRALTLNPSPRGEGLALSGGVGASFPPLPAQRSGEGQGVRANGLVRLPTEWEWQQAATGGRADFKYPWGAEWETGRANTSEAGIGRTSAAGLYPLGVSPVGALDMAGNVWEWCLNKHGAPQKIGLNGTDVRVLRGGSWLDGPQSARAARRNYSAPYHRDGNLGFRVVLGSPPT